MAAHASPNPPTYVPERDYRPEGPVARIQELGNLLDAVTDKQLTQVRLEFSVGNVVLVSTRPGRQSGTPPQTPKLEMPLPDVRVPSRKPLLYPPSYGGQLARDTA